MAREGEVLCFAGSIRQESSSFCTKVQSHFFSIQNDANHIFTSIWFGAVREQELVFLGNYDVKKGAKTPWGNLNIIYRLHSLHENKPFTCSQPGALTDSTVTRHPFPVLLIRRTTAHLHADEFLCAPVHQGTKRIYSVVALFPGCVDVGIHISEDLCTCRGTEFSDLVA